MIKTGRKSKISIQRSKAMKEYWSNVKSISQEKNIPIKQARKQITTKPKYISKKSLERSIRSKAYWNEVKTTANKLGISISKSREFLKKQKDLYKELNIKPKKIINYNTIWEDVKNKKKTSKEARKDIRELQELDYEFES